MTEEPVEVICVPRAVIRELRLAEDAYAKSKVGAVERLDAALSGLFVYEKAESAPSAEKQALIEALEKIAAKDFVSAEGEWAVQIARSTLLSMRNNGHG